MIVHKTVITMNTSHRTEVLNEYFPGSKLLVVITTYYIYVSLPTWLVFFQSMVLMAGPGYMSMRL